MHKIYSLLFLLVSTFSFSQSHLLISSDFDAPLLVENEESQITLEVDMHSFNSIKEFRPCELILDIPFFNNNTLQLNLESFSAFTNDFQLLRTNDNGMIYDAYQPDIQSYRIVGEGVSGSMSFMKNLLIGVIKYNGDVYEITHIEDNLYVLFDVNKCVAESSFSCQTDTEYNQVVTADSEPLEMMGGSECVEMGIEIDFYTYEQFANNCYDAVEWALALLAGVSEVYYSELNQMVTLQARYINVWEIVDNYDPLNDCGDMLDEMPNYWNNPPFNDIYAQTDLVHLFSRKNANGGIAFVGALCGGLSNANWGFGVTTGLNTTFTYDYPDNTPYSYNLSYLGHEIGHNFGSPHTHNCGWDADASLNFPGGAIDACADVEGACSSPLNPPNEVWQQSSGTIMSYCDLGSVGITLEFHPIVESQALIPGINGANCLTTCDDIETSCGNSIYGCTDSIAENFNPQANINDNSCEYIYGCISVNADNYNANATVDDGSCICSGEIDLYLETDYYSNEVSWELLDENGEVVDSGGDYFQGGEIITNSYCLSEGCYQFNIYDEWGDGISSDNTAGNTPNYYIYWVNNEYLIEMTNSDFGSESINPFCLVICEADVDQDGICDEDEIYGCTDSAFLEYNVLATEDDGSCQSLIIYGCTDEIACNYDNSANVDDDSCEFPELNFDCDGNCLSDINNDGICDLFGCMNSDACNYDNSANIDDDSCEFPELNFDCDGNCLVDIDCNGECAGDAIYDECGQCDGNGPLDFFDCDGNCLSDLDNDGICDQLDNCIEDFNPLQIDNDNDGYGDECSCQYIDINGEILVEAGLYEIYTLSTGIDNMASWEVIGGTIEWSSATEPSIGVQWLDVGQGSVIITQYFGVNQTCTIELNVTILPSTIDLEENLHTGKKLILITDVLGRPIDNVKNNKNHCLIYIYDNGSVEKIYQINK